MLKRSVPAVCVAALILLYLLHNDFWFRYNPQLIFGFPISLVYHVLFCIASAAMMIALVRYAWPPDLDAAQERREEL